MAKFILGRKLNMTQKFLEDGKVVPVTVVEAGPCTVVQVKGEKDGYTAVQVGFANKRKVNKPIAGHLKGFENFRYLKEFRVENSDTFEKGKVFDVTSFQVGDILKITATSKGKGFQGVVKRHGFHGSPATHGHKDQHRMPGSIGATDAARVFKGTRMGGRMGGDTTTVSNLELIEVDTEKNLLYIKGAVPGAREALVRIQANGDLVFVEKKAEPKKEEVKTEDKKEEKPVKEEAKKEAPKEIPAQEEKKVEEKPAEAKKEEAPKVEAKKDKVNGEAKEGGLGQEPKAEDKKVEAKK
ncbi:50S ribosomal protein L3 [Candidatus Parcubacteria bacterium]|jgi:large subunit ribosomal protein L3|nr:50S ribosomal protein L3 [Candidatus Parcubacteria bacterium]